jgi:hypothetical protein
VNWLDVCGSPGVGKSTLCDTLWNPHEIPIQDKLPPADWNPFLNEITRLLGIIQPHPSFVAAVRMNRRSVRKIATVARLRPTPNLSSWSVYIQTALVQRGLGFGWRLEQMGMSEEVRGYFDRMPVSIGVAFLHASAEIVAQRNTDRLKNPETAHENRDFMAPLMEPAIKIAKEVFNVRGVPFIEIDTTQPIEDARATLVEFASRQPYDPAQAGYLNKESVLQAPIWW